MQIGKNGWSKLVEFTPPLAWGDRELGNQRLSIHLSADLTHEMDQIRNRYRWALPEAMSYRAWFIETAVRYFIHFLKETGLVEVE